MFFHNILFFLSTVLVTVSFTTLSATAFILPPSISRVNSNRPTSNLHVDIAEVDSIGNNIIVKKTLAKAQSDGLLSKVYESGLLSKAQAAGVSLKSLEPVLKLASENPDILLLVESAGPDLLPLLPTIVDVAPAALPLLAAAIQVPTPIIAGGALVGPAAAFTIVQALPDNSIPSVAIQTLAVGILGLAVPAISLISSKLLSDLKK
mmetsp:Transcript_16903/g.34780  ORF Transcript_16903/g.34780 Transcript_16903/m.34780 type:complete len:206 (+) Transcript_16903:46-663(+)